MKRPPPRREGRPDPSPNGSKAPLPTSNQQTHREVSPHDRTARQGAAVAVGEVLPPAGRRTIAALLVRHCPSCNHVHLHRFGRAGEGVVVGERRPSCGGVPYLIMTSEGVIL